MTTTIYGIKNCNTMKKAFVWLDEQGIDFIFHDYKKAGADERVLKQAIAVHGWKTVINRRGTTWRKLPNDVKNAMDASKALEIALESPSIIKRPLLVHNAHLLLGFDENTYHALFKR